MSVSDSQTLGHERDGIDELRMPEFVCKENRLFCFGDDSHRARCASFTSQ